MSKTKRTTRVRRGLRVILSTVEGRLADEGAMERTSKRERDEIELALQWLREQAAEPAPRDSE